MNRNRAGQFSVKKYEKISLCLCCFSFLKELQCHGATTTPGICRNTVRGWLGRSVVRNFLVGFLENCPARFRPKLARTGPRECHNQNPRTFLSRLRKLSSKTALREVRWWPKCFLAVTYPKSVPQTTLRPNHTLALLRDWLEAKNWICL